MLLGDVQSLISYEEVSIKMISLFISSHLDTNLKGLDGHNKFEGDTSLTRKDYYLNNGDDYTFQGSMCELFISSESRLEALTLPKFKTPI
jgi:hypothetical protein